MDFFSEKELVAQIGHDVEEWPLVILKELIDNALDSCEEAGIPPKVSVTADAAGITVRRQPIRRGPWSSRRWPDAAHRPDVAWGTRLPR